MPTQETSAMQIGEWIVHPALDCISRGTETRKLEPRAMRLLLCLADSAGDVVSVDRLLADVWADVVVGSASVYEAVSQFRKILGDVDPKPTYIATVPRKGYRLIASVQRAMGPAPTHLKRRLCCVARQLRDESGPPQAPSSPSRWLRLTSWETKHGSQSTSQVTRCLPLVSVSATSRSRYCRLRT